jgi:sodium/potassium-transporting ATPase subunit alpha
LDPGSLALAIALVVVTLINVATTVFQDRSSSAVMKSIQKLMSAYSTVVRDGTPQQVPSAELVPGDVVNLALGDRVPADLRIISSAGLRVDQSILTGESEPVPLRTKCTSDNYLESKNITFCGASVVEGSGSGIVVATGNSTMMGSIAAKASKGKTKATYLSYEIRRLIIIIGCLCLFISASCFIAYVAWLQKKHKGFISWSGIVGICLGLMIGCFPVGLPLCVTATLLIVAKRMAKANVLVKDLTIIETLGSVNMIASDKTGTLTQNDMSVVEVLLGSSNVIASDAAFVRAFRDGSAQFEALLDVAVHCNSSSFDPATIHLPLKDREIIGGASDAALLKWSSLFVEDIEETRSKRPLICEIPFNSKNKYAVTVHKLKKKTYVMYMKGAAENMLARCTTYLDQDGNEEELTPKKAKAISNVQIAMCKKGERVLALIRKSISPSEQCPFLSADFNTDDYGLPIESGFTFVGLMALMDPPREEVPGVIEKCHEAGIKVAMVTGDHPDTAETIAKMIGIIRNDRVSRVPKDIIPYSLPPVDPRSTHSELNRPTREFFRDVEMANASVYPRAVVVTGPEIATFTDAHWDWVLAHRDLVFARTSPENKLEIVKKMQERGYSVAVTGDGVNDSPALKQADVGVAMGGGSEVAKEAAPVILTDNNFASLLSGVESGRIVFANLKKVIRYLMPAGSFSEIWPVVFNVFLGLPQPLSTFLMLFICVITDVAPCISLVFQRGEQKMMQRKPRSKGTHLLDPWIYLQSYLHVGVMESLAAFILFFYYMNTFAGIPMNKLWFAYEKFTVSPPTAISTYPNPKGGFYTGKELDEHLKMGQSIFFVTLVIAQFGNLLGSKENRSSIFSTSLRDPKQRNLFLLFSMPISLACALLVIYVPGINKLFGTRPISWEFWLLPLYPAFLIFISHEVRKWLWRNINWSAFGRWIRCERKKYHTTDPSDVPE